ncbi:MAG: globin [Epsilonproteobacteria bacterium]|nr:MAG: globin [Campylobacterota bacterium]
MYEAKDVEKGVRVNWKLPNPKFYEVLGFKKMKDLMYRFYDEIYDSSIAHFFPQDEEEFNIIKEKNSLFFIEICGGPKVYKEAASGTDLNEYMIRIHDEFSITEKARYEWLGCMETALRETPMPQELKDDFWDYLEKFSKLTVNTFDDGSTFYAAYEAGDVVP